MDETRASSPRQFGVLCKSPNVVFFLFPAATVTKWRRQQQQHFSRILNRFTERETSKYKVQLHAVRVALLVYSRAKPTCDAAQRKLQSRRIRTEQCVRFVRSCTIISRFVFSSDPIGQRAFAVAHSLARFSLGESRWRSGRRGEVRRASWRCYMIHHFYQVYMQVPSKNHSPWVAPKCGLTQETKPKVRAIFLQKTASCTLESEGKQQKKENIPGFGARHPTGSFLSFFFFLENVTKLSV